MSVIAKTETFQRDMAKAGASVNKFSTTSSRTTATVMKLGRSLMMMAGVGGGLYMLTRGIRGAIAAGLEQEKVERQLAAAIGGSISGMKKYAAEMQAQTIYGDELILSQMAYGKNLGINTEQLEAATTAAIGLAAKYRLELNSAMMLVGRAALGQTQMLTRYGIVLDDTLDPQEKFNALLKIGADNFHLAAAETKTATGALAQFKNNAGDMGEEMSMSVLPALTDMLSAVNENKDAWQDFFRVQLTGWAEVLSGFKSFGIIAEETAGRLQKALGESDEQLKQARRQGAALTNPPMMNQIIGGGGQFRGRGATGGWEETRNLTAAAEDAAGPVVVSPAGMTDEAMKAAATRLQISARMYNDMGVMGEGYYQAQVALLGHQKDEYSQHVTDKVLLEQWYAGELFKIQEEMRLSSLNAMGRYHEELQADMTDSARYTSEKFAGAAQEIEGSMSGAFQSMIQGGANFRDAMNQFFIDIGASFAKMAADMAARAAMNAILNSVVSGIAGGIGGGFNPAVQAGSPNYSPNLSTTGPTNAGVPSVLHSGWVPYGTPSFQRGRGLKSSEMVAVIEKDELLAPNKQVVKSGLGGGAGLTPESLKIVIVRNEREAQIEFGNSPAGEKVWIRHATRNRNLMR